MWAQLNTTDSDWRDKICPQTQQRGTDTHTHTENTHLRQNKYPKTTTPEFVYSLLSEERVHWGLVIKFTFWTETSFANSCRLTTTAADRHIQSKDELTLNNMIEQQVMTIALDGIVNKLLWIEVSLKYSSPLRHFMNTSADTERMTSPFQQCRVLLVDVKCTNQYLIFPSTVTVSSISARLSDYNSAISPSAFEQKWLENILCWWLPARLL